MPRDRRQRLFHRLVGALVLVALAVIVLPMILDFRVDYDTAITRSNIPERPAGLRMEEIPLQAPSRSTGPSASSGPASSVTHEAQAAAADVGEDEQAAVQPPAAPAKGWVVRVGSFSSAENARALRDQLRAKGYTAFVDQVQIDGKTMSRVHVGPEAQRERGEALRDRIAGEMNLKAIVVAYE